MLFSVILCPFVSDTKLHQWVSVRCAAGRPSVRGRSNLWSETRCQRCGEPPLLLESAFLLVSGLIRWVFKENNCVSSKAAARHLVVGVRISASGSIV